MPLEAQIKNMNDELEKEIGISIKKTSFIKCLNSDNEKIKSLKKSRSRSGLPMHQPQKSSPLNLKLLPYQI